LAQFIITTAGLNYALQSVINAGTIEIHLYSNVVTWSSTTSFSDFTECDFEGYSPVTTSGWSSPSPDDQGDEISNADVIEFQCFDVLGSGAIRGCWYYIPGSSVVFGGGNFDTIYVLNDGDTLTLPPMLQCRSQY
jgi:hypothetical protein